MNLNTDLIPEVIEKYNVYQDGMRLIGVADDITMPTMTAKTITVTGADIMGEVNAPSIGRFDSMEQEVTFNTLYSNFVTMLSPLRQVNLTIRAAQQNVDKSLGYDYKSLRIIESGRVKEFSPGKIKNGESMEAKVKIELTYIAIEVDGQEIVCIDKLNSIYRINGEDMLADISAMI